MPQGNDVRRAGEDIGARQSVLSAGPRLGPAELGVLASLGRAQLECFERARVAVISTGDELVEPGGELPRGSIYDSNSHALAALAAEAGATVHSRERVRDEAAATSAAIERALRSADVVVICGGVSVGAHDHVKASLAELGVQERFWRVALKPGKPTWFGTSGRNARVRAAGQSGLGDRHVHAARRAGTARARGRIAGRAAHGGGDRLRLREARRSRARAPLPAAR